MGRSAEDVGVPRISVDISRGCQTLMTGTGGGDRETSVTARIVMPLLVVMLVASACRSTTEFETHGGPLPVGPGGPVTTTGTINTTSVPRATTAATTTMAQPIESTTVPGSTIAGPPSIRPATVGDWELLPGDILVANSDGVQQMRDGALVGTPVTSPTHAAISDGMGGIILQPVEADPPPSGHLPEGALEIWRVSPEGPATLLHRSDVEAHSVGRITLFDVALVETLSMFPSLVFAESRCIDQVGPYCHPQDVLAALPLDGDSEPVAITAPVGSWEGGIGGVAWRPQHPGALIVSMGAEGSFWMSAWDISGDEIDWLENPNPYVADGAGNSIFSMAGISPNLVAYLEMHLFDSSTGAGFLVVSTDLVIYDTSIGLETKRLTIDPIVGWGYLHASGSTVAITSQSWSEEQQEHYRPVLLYDRVDDEFEVLQVAGRATVVPSNFCCFEPIESEDG